MAGQARAEGTTGAMTNDEDDVPLGSARHCDACLDAVSCVCSEMSHQRRCLGLLSRTRTRTHTAWHSEGGMRRSSRPSTQGSAAAGARSSQLSGGARAATRPDTPRPDAMHGACRAAARAHSPVALQTRKQGAAHAMQRRGRSPAAPGVGSARAGRVGLRRPHGTARRVLSVLHASDPGTRQGSRTSPPHRE